MTDKEQYIEETEAKLSKLASQMVKLLEEYYAITNNEHGDILILRTSLLNEATMFSSGAGSKLQIGNLINTYLEENPALKTLFAMKNMMANLTQLTTKKESDEKA